MRRVVQGFLVGAIVLDLVYWALWFTHRSSVASADTAAYESFENAFPLADAWLGVSCVLALVSMAQRRPAALLWLLCAGSAAVYLCCMDLLYDLENDVFFSSGANGIVELVIVLLTMLFAVVVLTWSWRHRGELLSGTPTQAQR